MDCGGKISQQNALEGEGRCLSCAKKYDFSSGKMNLKGEKAPGYKDGRYLKSHHCSECGSEICVKNAVCGSGVCSTCLGKDKIGNKNPSWKGGTTPLIRSIRHMAEYKKWVKEVFKRDDYTCQDCGIRGGKLEAHHIQGKEFAILFKLFLKEYNQFSPLDDKETLIRLSMKYQPFWDLSSGKTLCEDCHTKTMGISRESIKNFNS